MSLSATVLPYPGSRTAPARPAALSGVAQAEEAWMCAPAPVDGAEPARIRVGRWARSDLAHPLEQITDHEEPAHTISYCLRQEQVNVVSENRVIVPKTLLAGNMVLQAPTAAVRRGVFRSGYHVLRIYLPPEVIAECYEEITGKAAPRGLSLFDPHVSSDPVLQDLSRSLAAVDSDGGVLGPTFVDAIGMALAARLVALSLAREPLADKRSSPLTKRRLDAAMAYLEEHLSEQIYLSDLSAVAGLGRTQFVSQFRAATGLGPHAYILKRRIEVAQRLLLDDANPISDIALELGFSDQAHFSTAFKKQLGVSPGRWRAAIARQ